MKIKIISALVIVFLTYSHGMAQTTLSEAAMGKFLVGVAVNTQQVDGIKPKESELIAKEFNAVVAENCMKPQNIHPEEKKFNWTDADKFVAFGEKNKQVI